MDVRGHLERDSRRFLTVLHDVDGRTPVPTCPDWTADDLLFHLAEVQSFWARIVAEWLWRRAPLEPVQIDGDPETLARLQSVMEDGIS